ncbi:hybrid sensor histidine kinase/response regulator [Marinospirillum alkaliphilum]|uniref:Sensory/regulatory protein RpfC n=1 Tax=Marinospirillum alkaliphilum DSM 21637 TaxID=1122209 RepID=A0A1K1X2E6_9GAMM|nr:ATP-binding protein [Marinospirillum alkaliphilum]SFX43687.1 Signal transduction histidine kinase [Marinospirillum alkaliphilum DSM 21637]
MKRTSLFRSLLLSALLTTSAVLILLVTVMLMGIVKPLEHLARQEASVLAEKEISLRLAAKQEAVISIATSLARDPRVIQGLLQQDHPLAFTALHHLQQDFAASTEYKSVFAQVISPERRILARSWQPDFTGGVAPHPLVNQVLTSGIAAASFSVGNAGPGVLGFAPVFHEGQIIGAISVTQGLGSVVRALAAENMDWLLLLDQQTILRRFDGQMPTAYSSSPFFDENYLLAHSSWFDPQLARSIRERLPNLTAGSGQLHLLDNRLVFDLPMQDSTGEYIGRSLLITDDEILTARIQQGHTSIYLSVIAVLVVVIAVVALLMGLVNQRIIRPVEDLVHTINDAVASNRFSARFHSLSHDELGELSSSLNRLFGSLEQAIHEASNAITELAQGDLDRRITAPFQGDMEEFKTGFNAAAIKLQDTQLRLQEASNAKSQFLANMSHEIRTPINGVLGMLTLLEHTRLDAEQAEQVALARSSAELLLGLVNDILDFSKIEAGKMTLENLPLDLNRLTLQLQATFRNEAARKGLLLVTQVDPALSQWVSGDALRLQQILNNLLSNAFKFTEQGQITLALALANTGRLRISVTDTGIGIAPEAAQQLFQSFTQADSTTSRKYGGTGLGLKISKELVELMHGQMDFSSQPGQGSTFWLEIPYHPCQPPQRSQDQALQTPHWPDKKLLLVEDNTVNQLLAVKLLSKFGIKPDLAVNGEEAVKLAGKQAYDLILMDCQMPVMDGYTATRSLRASGYYHPIIALTANASTEDRDLCHAAGMDDFLAKPYRMESLIDILRKWLEKT